MKLYYKYEWDDSKRRFFISRTESHHRAELSKTSRKMVSELVLEISKKSGLSSKINLILGVLFIVFLIVLYILSYYLLQSQPSRKLYIFVLAIAPFICFTIFVVRFLGNKRLDGILQYMEVNDSRFKELLSSAELDISCYFFEGTNL